VKHPAASLGWVFSCATISNSACTNMRYVVGSGHASSRLLFSPQNRCSQSADDAAKPYERTFHYLDLEEASVAVREWLNSPTGNAPHRSYILETVIPGVFPRDFSNQLHESRGVSPPGGQPYFLAFSPGVSRGSALSRGLALFSSFFAGGQEPRTPADRMAFLIRRSVLLDPSRRTDRGCSRGSKLGVGVTVWAEPCPWLV
jgi:hypothetical protein